MRHRPIHHFLIQVHDLIHKVVGKVLSVLVVNGAHDNLELVYRLIIDDIPFWLGAFKDTLADAILDCLHILLAEKGIAKRILFPVAPEHIALKACFHLGLVSESRECVCEAAVSEDGIGEGLAWSRRYPLEEGATGRGGDVHVHAAILATGGEGAER